MIVTKQARILVVDDEPMVTRTLKAVLRVDGNMQCVAVNRPAEALERLRTLIKGAVTTRKKRRPTRPTKGSQQRRMAKKTKHGRLKTLRGKVDFD